MGSAKLWQENMHRRRNWGRGLSCILYGMKALSNSDFRRRRVQQKKQTRTGGMHTHRKKMKKKLDEREERRGHRHEIHTTHGARERCHTTVVRDSKGTPTSSTPTICSQKTIVGSSFLPNRACPSVAYVRKHLGLFQSLHTKPFHSQQWRKQTQ